MLFSGQGKVFAAVRDENGNPGPLRFMGNVPSLEVALAVENTDKRESTSGQRLLMKRLFTSKDANVTITLDEFTRENLALALYGAHATLAGGAVLDEEFPPDLAVGDFVRLAGQNITDLTIVDSDEPANTLDEDDGETEDPHYRIESAAHGTIEILSLAGLTQPLIADYTDGGGTNIAMFTQPPPVRWLRFEGLNTAEDDRPVLVELYNVQLSPVATLGLINDEFGGLELTGGALFDAARASDDEFGPFGRFILL